jgi:uncharacterized membrane protein
VNKGRLEAFSDGVIAIIITIMVLELKLPHGTDWIALRAILPTLGLYALSFVLLGIYWNNHHHMLHATERVNGRILWANLHLLFWLSLVPYATRWVGETRTAALPTAAYGVVLLMAGLAYFILERSIVGLHGPGSRVHTVLSDGTKEKISTAAYAAAIPLAFVDSRISLGIFVVVALMWLVPDGRIERTYR